MPLLSKQVTLSLFIVLAAVALQFSTTQPIQAQEGSSELAERPFRLPFVEPPGPNTWLVGQPYGNTTGAYRQRFSTYAASGGIHFGMDLHAPCGTEIVAIADGIVFAVDGPFGSPPHNLMIDHPQFGYASMYGHLLQPPDLKPGDGVKQGQVVALVGDSGGICYRRPHLHLEIRDLNHIRKFNPTLLIEANWDNLALIGSFGRTFARDLAEPRKWQTLYDQPEAQTGGPILNDFANPWPLDWSRQTSNAAETSNLVVAPVSIQTQPASAAPLAVLPIGRQITAGACCTQPYWSKDSTEVRFIDQPSPNAPLGIWGVDITQPESGPRLITERLGLYSRDGALVAYPNRSKGLTVIERLADGQKWEIDTQERSPNFTPDGRGLMWIASDEDAPGDTREETIWLANTDGSNAHAVFSARRTDPVAWLSADELLMSRSLPGTSEVQLFKLSLKDGRQTELTQTPRLRDLAFSPDRRHLVYYVSFDEEANRNGVWLMDLRNPKQTPQKLPFFGAYRWRDNEHLLYGLLDPQAAEHNFYEYHIVTGQTRPLFPAGTNLIVANNDWQISPDGRKIALVATNGFAFDGIWVLDLD